MENNHLLHGYECYRDIYLLFPSSLRNLVGKISNTQSEIVTKQSGIQYQRIKIPENKIIGSVDYNIQYSLIEEVTLSFRCDFVYGKLNEDARSRGLIYTESVFKEGEVLPYYPLMDPYLINQLEVEVYCGYKTLIDNRDYGNIYFQGKLVSMNPSFDIKGRAQVNMQFYDSSFDMSVVKRNFIYPCINSKVDLIDDYRKKIQDSLKKDLDEGRMSLEEFNKRVDKLPNAGSNINKTTASFRSWAERPYGVKDEKGNPTNSIEVVGELDNGLIGENKSTITLKDIIQGIFGEYSNKIQLVNIPPEFEFDVFSHENPLAQEGLSDYAFLKEILEARGYTFFRQGYGSKTQFSIRRGDDVLDTNPKSQFRFILYRPGHTLYDFNPFDIDQSTSENNIALNKDKIRAGDRNFVIKGGISLDVNANGYIAPDLKTFVTENGGDTVVTTETDPQTGQRTETTWVLDTERIDREILGENGGQDQSLEYIFGTITGKYSWNDIKIFFKQETVNRHSNDKTDMPFKRFIYQGWSTGFTTVGNPFIVIGNWYPIVGLGANWNFDWQCVEISHSFSHKWETTYQFQK